MNEIFQSIVKTQPTSLVFNVSEFIIKSKDIEFTLTGKNEVLEKADKLIINLPGKTIEFVNLSKLSDFLICPVCGAKVEFLNSRTFKLPCNCGAGFRC